MAWTMPVAIFFASIFLLLCGMTFWEIKSPTSLRRGFLPIETTRGDRLFIGLLATAYINLAFVGLSGKLGQWLGMSSDPSIWISFIFSLFVLGYIMHKG
jgi:predicted small integral membrane protein